MDLSKNPAEPTGECTLRIVKWNWVESYGWRNLQVDEIWQKWNWVKSAGWWNLKVGEICKLVKSTTVGKMDLDKNAAEPTGECRIRIVRWNWVKSESSWNLQVGEICK